MPPKRNPDSDAVTKILALYTLLLFEKKECCLRELAEKLVCSKQTILRLCARLSAFAPDFRTELREGERVYWLETPGTQTAPTLAPEALKCLAMCRNIAANLLPEEILRTSGEALQRAVELANDPGPHAQTAAPPAPAAPPAKARPAEPRDYSHCHEKISRLMKAIEERRVCIISYQDAPDTHSKEEHFLPLRLVAQDTTLCAEGWAVPDRPPIELLREMTLAVHRIRKISVTLRAVSRSQNIKWKTQRNIAG